MSKPWTIPKWWPLTQNRQAITGFSVDVWFFPELDQWHLSFGRNDLGQRLIKIGPLRFMAKPLGINREFRKSRVDQ